MRWITLAAVIGVTGCAMPVSDAGLCRGLNQPIGALRDALVGHPDTPDPVGMAGADVVLGFEAGCRD